MADSIKNQFNESTLNNPTFNLLGSGSMAQVLTAAGAAVPADFIGRERELQDIRQLFTSNGGTLALVNAEGGMGKTTLAAAYWKQFQQEYRHLAWLFCEQGILEAMRAQLPNPLGLQEAMNAHADNPEQQISIIRDRMANLNKDCLLVLDNANDPAHIQIFEQYCTGLGWHVLLTSRCSKVLADRSHEYPITSLPPAEARKLFKNNHDEPQNPDFEALLDRFLLAVGHNTLCIEVFSKNLREGAAWGLSLTQLLEKIEQNGLRLGQNSFETPTHWAQTLRSGAITSDQIIESLYNVSSLSAEEKDLLVQFCLLPAESHSPEVLTALLSPRPEPKPKPKNWSFLTNWFLKKAKKPPEPELPLKTSLDRLVQKGWLSSDAATYRVSPVVQKIVLARHVEQLWSLGKPIVSKLQAIFATEGYHSKNIQSAGPFADLVFGLVDNLGEANIDIAVLYDRLWVYYTATGNLAQAMNSAKRMESNCEQYGDKNNLAVAYNKLGETHRALGNLQQALTFSEQDIELSKELYAAYPQNVDFKNGLAISYSKLGQTHCDLGNLSQALAFFEERSRLGQELYAAYPQNVDFKNGLAISYSKLGETHRDLGNLSQALTFFEERSRLGQELYAAYPQNVEFKNGLAISYSKLGETHSNLGNLQKALTFFEDETKLFEELYAAYPQNVSFKNGLAVSYSKLGETHSDLGNLQQALTFFEKDIELSKELYADYPQNVSFKNGLAISYSKLGQTHSDLGNLNLALTFFEKDIELSKKLYADYPRNVSFKNNLAISYAKLGVLYRDQLKEPDQASAYFKLCHTLRKELVEHHPDYPEFKNNYEWIENALLELEQASDPAYQLYQRIQNEPEPQLQYPLYRELCTILRDRNVENPSQKNELITALNDRAWAGFFLQLFLDCEADVREGLALDAENKHLLSNLAPALLLQGKREAALAEYQKWKDLPFDERFPSFREAFLDDLSIFEKAGVIPAERQRDVEAAREVLGKV